MTMLTQILPLAARYRSLLTTYNATDSVRDQADAYHTQFLGTERHLQCLWYDARLRPASFSLDNRVQEVVTILDPGTWNLEAGPDFLNATLLLEPGKRQLRGDVELHIQPHDWKRHGHQHDPAYGNVIAHVTWFASRAKDLLPEHVISFSMAKAMATMPYVALDDIDLKAYPYAVLPATPRPCQLLLEHRPDTAAALLQAAGQYRMQLKSSRLLRHLQQGCERHQLFYEEVMGALGYKHNQIPFRMVARQAPLAALGVGRTEALAYLLGSARLLPQPEVASSAESRQFIRQLWDYWWRNSNIPVPATMQWKRASLRPQNSPERRLATAAALFSGMCSILDELDQLAFDDLQLWFKQARALFRQRCQWPYWQRYLNFNSEPADQSTALLGDNRIGAILANIVLPLAIAENRLPAQQLEQLPPEDLSAPMRQTAYYLLGRDHNPALYNQNALMQQGLLQIQLDFCINARPACENCRLNAHLISLFK